MGDFIPELEEGDVTAEKVPDVYDKLESLIRCQLAEERRVGDVLIEFGTPVVSIGIMDAGKITATTFGSPRSSRETATHAAAKLFDNDTLFQAASISKAITALAVIKLCQEGKLDLDAPISQYLSSEQISWISTPKTQALVSQISLRLLLSHTSGLRVHGFEGYSTTHIPNLPQILRGDPPANNEQISLFTLPGLGTAYSGGGFTVMQAPAYLTGKNKSDPDYHVYPEIAAAALWTTPSDLLRAIYAVQRSLKSYNFLERKWAKTMLTEIRNDAMGMALGWAAKKGTILFGHTGSNPPGYKCGVFGYADLAQLDANQDEESSCSVLGYTVVERVINAITYSKGWPSVFERPVVPFLDRASTIDARAKHWCGDWGPGDWSLVNEDGGGIFVRYGSLPALPLVPGALPPHKYDEGNSIDLVADGLDLMLRLGWKEGSRMIEVWQNDTVITLERKT